MKAPAKIMTVALFALTCATGAWAREKIKIGIANSSSDIVYFIAQKKGYFDAEGIDAEVIPFASATQMIAPLGVGELDVGGGGPGAGLYNAAGRGVAVKVVADKGSMPPGYGFFSLLVRKDLIASGKVKTIADLKGMKIGDTSKQGSGDVTLSLALAKGGLKFEDIDPVYMAAPQLAAALRGGALDATLIQEPVGRRGRWIGGAVRQGRRDLSQPAACGDFFQRQAGARQSRSRPALHERLCARRPLLQ